MLSLLVKMVQNINAKTKMFARIENAISNTLVNPIVSLVETALFKRGNRIKENVPSIPVLDLVKV